MFVAWPHTAPNFPSFPQRLGIVYCFNRPCALWATSAPDTSTQAASKDAAPAEANGNQGSTPAADAGRPDRAAADGDSDTAPVAAAQQQALKLTSDLQSAFSPRFQPDSSGRDGRLVFLSQQAACESGVHNGTTSVHSLPWETVSALSPLHLQGLCLGLCFPQQSQASRLCQNSCEHGHFKCTDLHLHHAL